MRILFVSNLFPDQREPYRGLDNARVLKELLPRHQIKAIALRPVLPWKKVQWKPRPEDALFQPIYVPVPYVPKLGTFFNHHLIAQRLRPLLRGALGSFDIVLASWIFPDCCAVATLSQELNFPFVAIAQGSDVHQYLGMPIRRRVILRSLRTAGGIITRSRNLADRLSDAGVPSGKLHPIYNGVDLNQFHPGDKAAMRKSFGPSEDGFILLFVGNFFDIKNPLALIEAHRRVQAMGTACSLVMIGGGPLEARMRKAAGPNVIFAGRKNAAEVASYMKAADLLCLPSWNEGVPNVILEALASGLPVVASKVGGIPEIIREPYLGSLVPAGDVDALTSAISAELALGDRTKEVAAFGRQFRWETTAEQYAGVLTAAVESFR